MNERQRLMAKIREAQNQARNSGEPAVRMAFNDIALEYLTKLDAMEQALKQFEYASFSLAGQKIDVLNGFLNDQGTQGWELITVVAETSESYPLAFFKREKRS